MRKWINILEENNAQKLAKILSTLNIDPKHIDIDSDGRVDVDTTVKVEGKHYEKFPIRFGKVNGDFKYTDSTSLTTLEGGPIYVGRHFEITGCKRVTSFKYMPERILGWVKANDCGIETCDHFTQTFEGIICLDDNQNLHSLEGLPPKFKSLRVPKCPKLRPSAFRPLLFCDIEPRAALLSDYETFDKAMKEFMRIKKEGSDDEIAEKFMEVDKLIDDLEESV